MNTEERKTVKVIGWFVSLVVHISVALLFLNIVIDTDKTEREFVEVSLAENVPVKQQQETPRPVQQESTPQATSQPAKSTRLVDLVKRRMDEREEATLPDQIKDTEVTDIAPSKIGAQADNTAGKLMENRELTRSSKQGERELPGARIIDVGSKATTEFNTQGLGGDVISERPFEISWEGGDREVLAAPLPTIPESVNKTTVLKFRITARPDGSMGETLPLQKGNATLEALTMQALKKWRFNPLEPSAPQITQSGIVTFRFILK